MLKIKIKNVFVMAVLAGVVVIMYSIWQVYNSSGIILWIVLRTGAITVKICAVVLKTLILKSLPVIWFPALTYLVLSWFIRNTPARKGALLIVISLQFALIAHIVFPHNGLFLFSITRLPLVFTLILQLYMFILFFLPGEIWNFLGAVILLFKGMAVMLLPDLPSFADDFGIILAVFSFLFLYMHTLASLVKRAGEKESLERTERFIYRMTCHAAELKKHLGGQA